MQTLGKLVGISRSGRWIVRGEAVPPLGATVVDKDLAVLGRVGDVFGPVERPFISVNLRESSATVSPGENVYFLTRKDKRLGRWRSSKT